MEIDIGLEPDVCEMTLTDDAWISILQSYVSICRELARALNATATCLADDVATRLSGRDTDDAEEAAVKREQLRRLVAIRTVPSDLVIAYQLLTQSLYEMASRADD